MTHSVVHAGAQKDLLQDAVSLPWRCSQDGLEAAHLGSLIQPVAALCSHEHLGALCPKDLDRPHVTLLDKI